MSNPDTVVTNSDFWVYDRPPVNESKKMLLLTQGKIAILGPWRGTIGVIAWHGLPDRDKDLELELGV
jgi:hypothetical protein